MKIQYLLVAIGLYASTVFAQSGKTYLTTRYTLDRMGTLTTNANNTVIPGLQPVAPDILGDPFLLPNFSEMSALLYNDQTINRVQVKYNLLQDDFYIQTKAGLRVLPGSKVKSFTLIDSLSKKQSLFINGNEFLVGSGTPSAGFFEVLYDGQTALLKKSIATIQKANYNVALGVGRQDHQVYRKFQYYYLANDKIEKLPSPKRITSIFGDKKASVEKFIKVNQLNLKDERHLILAFEYYNQGLVK